MPIAIECPSCHHEYKVGDNLAGKKVKCRECGEAIAVMDPNAVPEPDIIGLDDSPEAAPVAGPSVRRCPSCRTPNTPTAIKCIACGYNMRPEPTVKVETFDVAEPKEKKKKSRFVRRPGNPGLESVDGIIQLVMWWGSIAALAVWIVHIARSPSGLAMGNLIPVFVVIALGLAVLAPLATLAINLTANVMQFPPRHDVYTRVVVSLLLPFSASLLTGWPGNNSPVFAQIASLSWVAFPALFIYLFRAEVMECVATVVAGGVAIAVGWGVGLFVVSMITSATAPLYADMLPPGPWQSLAKGQSPPPATAPATPAAPQVAAVSPTPTPSAATTTDPATSLFSAAPNDPGAESPLSAGIQHPTAAITHAPGAAPPTAATPLTPNAVTPVDVGPQPTFFTDIGTEDANLTGVRDLVTITPPSPWMLLVKGAENGGPVTAERWSLQPTTRKSVVNFSELPKQPNSYALSPKGDVLVAVVRFPRNQIQISTFDNKPVRNIPLPDNGGAIPTLLGFLSPTQYAVEWDLHGQTKLQLFNVGSSVPLRTISVEVRSTSTPLYAFAPNGRTMATLSFGTTGEQIVIYNLETGMIAKRITPTTTAFRPLGLAYSPDSTQVALYATISEASTILAFNVQSGQPGFNGMLQAPAVATPEGRGAAHPPALLWLQNNLAWLINGNDVYETSSGKKLGALNLPDLVDARLVGADSLAIVQSTAEGAHKVTIAKFDDAAIKGTKTTVASPPPAP